MKFFYGKILFEILLSWIIYKWIAVKCQMCMKYD